MPNYHPHAPLCECRYCQRGAELLAKEALFDEMRQSLTKVLMVSLLPRDISGCRMIEESREVLFRANKIAEAQ